MGHRWTVWRGAFGCGLLLVVGAAACGAKVTSDGVVPPGSGGSGATGGARTGSGGLSAEHPQGPHSQGGRGGAPNSPRPGGVAGEPDAEGGKPECGGCAPDYYAVWCARHVVTVQPTSGAPDYGRFDSPEAACAAAQRELTDAVGGAGGDAAGSAGAGGAGADACATYVDPPVTYYDDGPCIGYDDQRFADTCVVAGECCVTISYISCGI